MTTIGDSSPAGQAQDVERYGPQWTPPPFERGTDGPRVILVGIDGSNTSLRATMYACGLARRQRCQLVVAYAIPLATWAWALPGGGALLQHTLDELESGLRAEVRQLAEEVCVPVSFVSRRGHPHECLRSIADEVKADMVVVGASSQTHYLLGGSVANRLIRLGRWPIIVVP